MLVWYQTPFYSRYSNFYKSIIALSNKLPDKTARAGTIHQYSLTDRHVISNLPISRYRRRSNGARDRSRSLLLMPASQEAINTCACARVMHRYRSLRSPFFRTIFYDRPLPYRFSRDISKLPQHPLDHCKLPLDLSGTCSRGTVNVAILSRSHFNGVNDWNEDNCGLATLRNLQPTPGTWLFSSLGQIEQIGIISKPSHSVAPLLPMNVNDFKHMHVCIVCAIIWYICLSKTACSF